MRIRAGPLLICLLGGALLIAGCGSSGSSSGTSSTPLTLDHVKAKLVKAGYKVTVYSKNEGVLQIDATHKADAGLSIDNAPSGQQLYAAVYETRDPAVRAVVISRNSDEAAPIVRGDLIFTISGTEPELRTIVKDAGGAAPSARKSPSASAAGTAAATAAMQHFIDVYAAADEPSMCASLTPQALAKSQTFCDPTSIFYKRKRDPRVKQYLISSVTTIGNTATAAVTFEGITEQIALRKVNGHWKIDTEVGASRLF